MLGQYYASLPRDIPTHVKGCQISTPCGVAECFVCFEEGGLNSANFHFSN